jgi:multicomponent Na+:H+ antiporter subunit G
MISDLVCYVSGVCLLIGALFSLAATIGVLRFPDLYTRLHAAAKAGPVGVGFILLAVAMAAASPPVALRALIGIVLLILTTPIAAHLLARAAYLVDITPDTLTKVNDLENEKLSGG